MNRSLKYHHNASGEQKQTSQNGFPRKGFAEKDDCEDNGEYQTAFVDGHDFAHIAVLYGVKIAEPRRPCRDSGKDEE